MPNNRNPRPLEGALQELQGFGFSKDTIRLFRDTFTRSDKVLTDKGEVQAVANVTGRTEPLSTTLGNVTAVGKLNTADAIAADGVTFGRVNVTALTTNNVDLAKAGVTNKTANNITETSSLKWRTAPHSATQPVSLTITGIDDGAGVAHITTSSYTQRVPGLTDTTISNSLMLGLANSTKYYLYMDTPNFDSQPVFAITDPNSIFSNPGRVYVGLVTTPAGGAGNTSGTIGGTGGSRNFNTVLS